MIEKFVTGGPGPSASRRGILKGAAALGVVGSFPAMITRSAVAAGKPITIAFIPGIASDPFFKAMELGARNKAKELGVNLMWQGSASDYSPQTQMPFVDAALTNGVDALILVPTDPQCDAAGGRPRGIDEDSRHHRRYDRCRPILFDLLHHGRQRRRRAQGGGNARRA